MRGPSLPFARCNWPPVREFKWNQLPKSTHPGNLSPMAKSYVVTTTCDVCGGTATSEVTLNGYQMDLCPEHARPLEDYKGLGTRVGGATRSRSKATPAGGSSDKAELARIRSWAQANGFKIGDRGRISQEIRDAYAAANG